MMGNDADANDAAQEAMILLVRRLDRYDGRAAFTTWAYRVVTNSCLDELRRRKRRPRPTDVADETALATPTRSSSTASPESAVAARIDVDAALAQVPLEFRVPVVLRDLCDLDYAEIADVLAVPAGTVKSRIARGRAALARAIEADPAPAGNQDPSDDRQKG